MGDKTIVVRASRKSPSVRTTIPERVAREIGIEAGDVLDWEISHERERPTMKVKKLE